MTVIYFIEANIGTGKSTFLSLVEKYYSDIAQVIYEPVDTWTNFKDKDGVNILDHFYNSPQKYAYVFQNIAFMSKVNLISQIDMTKQFVFIERSIWSDKYVFAKNCYLNKMMNNIEYQVYLMWFDWIQEKCNTIASKKFVYLKCEPEISFQRLQKRGRKEECGIDINYIRQIHDRHEEWLVNEYNVMTVYANDNLTKEEEFKSIFNSIINN